jgi:RNA polymerase nonessential primary-like sigma factor
MDALDVQQLRIKYADLTNCRHDLLTFPREEVGHARSGSSLAENEDASESGADIDDDDLGHEDGLRGVDQSDEISVLNSVSSTAHLADDEVLKHFFWIEAGVLAEEQILSNPDVSDEFTLALHEVAVRGVESFKVLVQSNLRLVLSMARRSSPRIPLSDRFQAGCEGLIRAIEKYDFRLGYKFSTYATHWIRQSIFREIYNSGTIVRTPVHLDEKLTWDKENEVMRFKSDVNFSQLDRIWILSLYEPLDVDDFDVHAEVNWTSLVPTSTESDWVAEGHPIDLLGAVRSILLFAGLDERAFEVLRKRFGFEGEPQTLDEIGKVFRVTRERIRQIEKQAMDALREYSFVLVDLGVVMTAKELDVT